MAGNTAILSKLTKLKRGIKNVFLGKRVSVVRYRSGEPIQYPENVADNILLVPYPCDSEAEWERQAMANAAQRDDT